MNAFVLAKGRLRTPADAAIAVGGFERFSAIDYPGALAAVVFVQGCPWDCGYCQNPALRSRRDKRARIAWSDVVAALHARRGFLDAVVFSGGEPTNDPYLESAIATVKSMGFRVGLHTGGIYPARLAKLLPLLDWVGLDIKAPRRLYAYITGEASSGSRARAALALVLESGVDYELRTTVHPAQLDLQALLELAAEVRAAGGKHLILQRFRATGCTDARLRAAEEADWPSPAALAAMRAVLPGTMLRAE